MDNSTVPHQPSTMPRVCSAKPSDADEHHRQNLRARSQGLRPTTVATVASRDIRTAGHMWDQAQRRPVARRRV